MDDMRAADIDFLTIGQYLQPTPKHHVLDRFVTPDEFAAYEKAAFGKGFLMVSATPLTRSSYHAGDDFARLREARLKKTWSGLKGFDPRAAWLDRQRVGPTDIAFDHKDDRASNDDTDNKFQPPHRRWMSGPF